MGRPSLIKNTEWQDIVDRCIADGWTSAAIALYLKSRFGYEVNESTIRHYRLDEKKRIDKEYADVLVQSKQRAYVEAHVEDGHIVDHLGLLGDMIRLQRERIEVDLAIEKRMSLLSPQTRSELELLGKMIVQYHSILQDFGVVPRIGEAGLANVIPPGSATVSFPLLEMLDNEEQDKVIELSRAVHEKQKRLALEAGTSSAS